MISEGLPISSTNLPGVVVIAPTSRTPLAIAKLSIVPDALEIVPVTI